MNFELDEDYRAVNNKIQEAQRFLLDAAVLSPSRLEPDNMHAAMNCLAAAHAMIRLKLQISGMLSTNDS